MSNHLLMLLLVAAGLSLLFSGIHVVYVLGAIIFGSDQEVAGVMRAIRRWVSDKTTASMTMWWMRWRVNEEWTRSNWFSRHVSLIIIFFIVDAETTRQAPSPGLEVMDGPHGTSCPMEMNRRSRERSRSSHRQIQVSPQISSELFFSSYTSFIIHYSNRIWRIFPQSHRRKQPSQSVVCRVLGNSFWM